ncbi:MAG TPA: HlyD family efflux transporter periplasmic adaptor subunit [Opitutaceae bacterium]|nr:HlyD family efflux transporter periplasmic adaptor subunit [Opitutaceae bacterium]
MRLTLLFAAALPLLAGCAPRPPAGYQGYLEGEYVYVGAPLAGRLETLSVAKGARVTAGTPLFTLERAAELAAQRQAADQLQSAEARLEDLKKGSRPSELATLAARLDQARAAAELSRLEFERQQDLFNRHAIAASDYDRARLAHEQNVHAADEIAAQLETARLGGRPDAIAAATADVRAAQSARERADWNVQQKTQSAPRAGLVFDTLYREGEYVNAGSPVVSLLPPENLKVRFFVPESDFGALQAGGRVQVAITGRPAALDARISYLSPQPEYTPPILYNRENRAKLVFMIEAVFDAGVGADLHPGQPVDVTLAK